MTCRFLTDAELAAMDLPLVMRAAVCFSCLPDAEIIQRMGWDTRNGYRLLNPQDDYWPGIPSLPRLCRVLGNDILVRWLAVQSRGELDVPDRELTPAALLGELGDLFRRMGDVARRGQESLADGIISMGEARSMRRCVEDLLREAVGMMALLMPRGDADGRI
ncbi:hypothetical protein AB9L11_00735 [Desulfovibrio piger]